MRTALRMVALTAPFWAIYVPGTLMGGLGMFYSPEFLDPSERLYWMLGPLGFGTILTALLLCNTLLLSKQQVVFPPLKSASIPPGDVRKVEWFWDKVERETYLRFHIEPGNHIDIHHLRLSPKKLVDLREALKTFSPRCQFDCQPEDLEDLIAFRERFYKPRNLTLQQSESKQTTDSIEIPYHPHRQYREFLHSLGQNEKYFWYCWMTMLLVPVICKIPDMLWTLFCNLEGVTTWFDVPWGIQLLDGIVGFVFSLGAFGLEQAGDFYFNATEHPFVICMLIGATAVAIVALLMFLCQPNGMKLTRAGLKLYFQWNKIVLFEKTYPWQKMTAFHLDQFGDVVNPEKWRMQMKMKDRSTVNLRLEAIMGSEARDTLLKTITQMAPEAVQDPALIRALMPAQKESYTELWLQSLAAPPKRNRLAPLSEGQKLRDGRYLVERQLAIGGQGTAYLGEEIDKTDGSFVAKGEQHHKIVLKEFVLPVYTSRAVRKQALEKFENEARILGELNHPRIVKLIDYFLEDHRAYLVMEHIDGVSLRDLVQEKGSLSRAQLLDLSVQMCDVLQYLHSLSPPVVHRDFTPENLILNRDGKLVLIDFNVAQQREWTTTGTVVGKHAYLPPEQFRGQPCEQSDLYAMGATLFYLCTGKDPEPITCSHPAKESATVESDIDSIVAKLTKIELTDRFATIEDVRKAIDGLGGNRTKESPNRDIVGDHRVCEPDENGAHDSAITLTLEEASEIISTIITDNSANKEKLPARSKK
jgi:tRNA A-37 threonylcarbamoyl transferase component Bud32